MMSKYINDDLQIPSDDFDEKASDESGNADKQASDKETDGDASILAFPEQEIQTNLT